MAATTQQNTIKAVGDMAENGFIPSLLKMGLENSIQLADCSTNFLGDETEEMRQAYFGEKTALFERTYFAFQNNLFDLFAEKTELDPVVYHLIYLGNNAVMLHLNCSDVTQQATVETAYEDVKTSKFAISLALSICAWNAASWNYHHQGLHELSDFCATMYYVLRDKAFSLPLSKEDKRAIMTIID